MGWKSGHRVTLPAAYTDCLPLPKEILSQLETEGKTQGGPLLRRASPGGRVGSGKSWEDFFILPFWNDRAAGRFTSVRVRTKGLGGLPSPACDLGSLLPHGCPCSMSGQLHLAIEPLLSQNSLIRRIQTRCRDQCNRTVCTACRCNWSCQRQAAF